MSNDFSKDEEGICEYPKTKILIFGVTGDLSRNKLIPALNKIVSSESYKNISVIGVSRHEANKDTILGEHGSILNDRFRVITMDVSLHDEYTRLIKEINLEANEQLLIYLSVPPFAATHIVDYIGQAGLNGKNVKLLLEKPFGVDLHSAIDMTEKISKYFSEDQIYRIDHYLAKEMAQNIVIFRKCNPIFANTWNRDHIENIEIVSSEAIGVEGRGNFYEQTGALRDVVQGHLMQLLSLVIMDIQKKFTWDMLPKMRLDAVKFVELDDVSKVYRAQYDNYLNDVNVDCSCVETFVSIGLKSNDLRWKDVPFTLIAGKALDRKSTEIFVHFKSPGRSESNCLKFFVQPNEGVELDLLVKKPGYGKQLESRRMSFNYPENSKLPDAYEQVIVDAVCSRKSLFASNEEVIRSWEILQPVLDKWSMNDLDIYRYKTGLDYFSVMEGIGNS